MSAGVRPVAMSSAICSPPAGIALKPHVPHPVVMRKPSTPVSPMIGEKSADTSHNPVHCRRMRRLRRNGSISASLVDTLCRFWKLVCVAYDGCASNSAPMSICPRAVCDT